MQVLHLGHRLTYTPSWCAVLSNYPLDHVNPLYNIPHIIICGILYSKLRMHYTLFVNYNRIK